MPGRPVSIRQAGGTQSIGRAAALLRIIATRNSVGLRLSELIGATGLERPTARRILQGLMREGFVRQAPETHRYFLGPALFELGLAASPRLDPRGLCTPSIERIAARTGDTAFLTLRSAFDSVCVDRREGSYPVRALTVEIGARRALGSTAGGIALLMGLPDDELETILRANALRLPRYGTLTAARLRRMVERARTLGYGLNSNDIIDGVSGVAIPLPPIPYLPPLALSVAAISSRLDDRRQRDVVEIMRQEAELILAGVEASNLA